MEKILSLSQAKNPSPEYMTLLKEAAAMESLDLPRSLLQASIRMMKNEEDIRFKVIHRILA